MKRVVPAESWCMAHICSEDAVKAIYSKFTLQCMWAFGGKTGFMIVIFIMKRLLELSKLRMRGEVRSEPRHIEFYYQFILSSLIRSLAVLFQLRSSNVSKI